MSRNGAPPSINIGLYGKIPVPLVSDVPKRRTAEGALDPVPVSEHLSADSGRVPLVIGFKWDKHGDRLAPVGDDDPLPLGHPLEEMGEVRLRLERAYARHKPSDKLAHKTRLPHPREKWEAGLTVRISPF